MIELVVALAALVFILGWLLYNTIQENGELQEEARAARRELENVKKAARIQIQPDKPHDEWIDDWLNKLRERDVHE